jgi:hypothetical protein
MVRATATLRPRRRNNVLKSVERLESRTVLSASPLSLQIDLAIVGTDVSFSPLGLPASMGGDVYLSGNSATKVGRYSEVLSPIFMDINNDLQPDFVGTTGISTFSFTVGGNNQLTIGALVTSNISLIQGVDQLGQMLVGSVGTITASTGILRGAAGGFQSQSVVGLFPTFNMQTVVHFSVDLTSNVIAGGLRSIQNAPQTPAAKVTTTDNDYSAQLTSPPSINNQHSDNNSAGDQSRGTSPLSDRSTRVSQPRELLNRIPQGHRGGILQDAIDHRYDAAADGLFA